MNVVFDRSSTETLIRFLLIFNDKHKIYNEKQLQDFKSENIQRLSINAWQLESNIIVQYNSIVENNFYLT